MKDAVELWLYRRLRPLVRGRSQREVGGPMLPDDIRSGGVSRLRKVAAGAVLVVAATTSGTLVGYGWGQEEAAPGAGARALAGPVSEACHARADAAQAELAREKGIGPDDGVASLLVGAAEVEECRAGLGLEAAEVRSQAVRHLVVLEARKAGPGE